MKPLPGKYLLRKPAKRGQPILATRMPGGSSVDLGAAPMDIPKGATITVDVNGNIKVV